MKYSILFPYYSRPEIKYSLSSFCDKYKNRNDYEVVVIEDTKNFDNEKLHNELLDIIQLYEQFISIRLELDPKVSYNSASKYNLGAKVSNAHFLILSNPETVHLHDVLGYLDRNARPTGFYYVFDCMSLDKNFNFLQWYQHKTINRMYHFCSCIAKQDFPGFNEAFCSGIAYEDDSFIQRIKHSDLTIQCVDSHVVGHVSHPRDYSLDPIEKQRLVKINEDLWKQCIQTGLF